ncbi:unnamed protein product [Cercospora beticola]|nr:unnamed protein product [Cercospora beticola]
MTVDPTIPKGLFYTLLGEHGQQIPGGDWNADAWRTRKGERTEQGTREALPCGGYLAAELLESWRPADLIVSVYSSCFCEYNVYAPASAAETVSFLLEKSTSYGRLTPKATDLPLAGQRNSNNAASETSRPEPDTKTSTALASIPISTVGQPSTRSGEQSPSQASESISTEADAGLLQNAGQQSTRTAESAVISSPMASGSPAKPSTPVKDTASASPSASVSNAASSRIVSSVQPSVTPSSSSPEGSRGSTPTAQDKIEPQDAQTQSDTANSLESARLETASRSEALLSLSSPLAEDSTDPALSSQRTTPPQGVPTEPSTVNSQPGESASFRFAASSEQSGTPPLSSSEVSTDPVPSSQRTTESPSVLVKPVPASSQSAATSSDAPAAAVVVADGQLSMVSVESSSESGALSQSSSVKIGDVIASGIGETTDSSAIETSSQDSVTTEASPTTRTVADSKTSNPINTTSQPSRADITCCRRHHSFCNGSD